MDIKDIAKLLEARHDRSVQNQLMNLHVAVKDFHDASKRYQIGDAEMADAASRVKACMYKVDEAVAEYTVIAAKVKA